MPQLCRLFFQFTQTLRSRFPGKAALCGFFLKLFAAPRCRQRTRYAVQRLGDGRLTLFLLLDLVPALGFAAEERGMAENQLPAFRVAYVVQREASCLALDIGVEQNLK